MTPEETIARLKDQLQCYRGAYSLLLDMYVGTAASSPVSEETRALCLDAALTWFHNHERRCAVNAEESP